MADVSRTPDNSGASDFDRLDRPHLPPELVEVADALWLEAHGAPPLEKDPVAKMLGLTEATDRAVSPITDDQRRAAFAAGRAEWAAFYPGIGDDAVVDLIVGKVIDIVAGVSAGCVASTGAPSNGITDDMVEAALLGAMGYDAVQDDDGPKGDDYFRAQMREALSAALAGCTVVPGAPEPDMQREQLDGVMQIWNVGGWSVTAIGDKVAIKFGRDGLGDGVAFMPDTVRAICAAMLAGADLLAGGSQVGDQHGE